MIGALNPGMLRLAGEIADGVLLNYLPASHVPWSVEQVRKGGDAEVYAYVHVGVADRDAAAENARKDLFSYAVVDAYARNFERAGFADEVADIRERHAGQGPRGCAWPRCRDRMVDAIDVVGDAAHVQATIEDYVAAGVDHPIVMPLPWGEDRRQVITDTLRAAIAADRSGPHLPPEGEDRSARTGGQPSSSGTTRPSGSSPPAASQSA